MKIDKLLPSFKKIISRNIIYIAIFGTALLILICSSTFNISSPDASKTDSALESRLKNILEKVEGVGKLSIMITCKEDYKSREVEGVIIVAQGADNIAVKRSICDAAVAVLGVPPHKVQVFATGKKGK